MNLITDDWRLKLLAVGLALLMLGAVAFSQNPPTTKIFEHVYTSLNFRKIVPSQFMAGASPSMPSFMKIKSKKIPLIRNVAASKSTAHGKVKN